MSSEEQQDQESAGEKESAGPDATAMDSEPNASVETDPIAATSEEGELGFFAKLNPLRMMRRRSVEGLVEEGRDLTENGSLAQAIVAFQKAIELDANCIPAYRGLGKVYYKRGGRSNMETALKHYQEAIRRNPKEHDLYAITAKIYDAIGKRKEATLERKKFVIVRALDADPRNPIANNNMGILFMQQGRMDDAVDYFNRALQADRHYDVAYRNLAATYFQMAKKAGDDDDKRVTFNNKAREYIDKALEIAPTVPTLMAHARIMMMDGDLEDVLAVLEKVDQMAPANPEVFFMMKMAYEGLGRFEEAGNAEESYRVFKGQAAQAAQESPPAE